VQSEIDAMNSLKYVIAFAVAPLFFLAGIAKVVAARRSPEGKRALLRQGALYGLAGVVWLLVALFLHA
jgi:hypothetical protein